MKRRRPYRLGLTGSIGMGKSTTAAMFAGQGVPVWDADAVVHGLYAPGGAGVAVIGELVPEAIRRGGVDRDTLRAAVAADPGLLPLLEERVHPLVRDDREAFLRQNSGADILLFDIPLLFETCAETWLDGVAVVTAPAEVQRARVLERPGMSDPTLEQILARQIPDAEKRLRADFVIRTDLGLESAREAVQEVLAEIRGGKRGNLDA